MKKYLLLLLICLSIKINAQSTVTVSGGTSAAASANGIYNYAGVTNIHGVDRKYFDMPSSTFRIEFRYNTTFNLYEWEVWESTERGGIGVVRFYNSSQSVVVPTTNWMLDIATGAPEISYPLTSAPTATINAAGNITATGATLNGTINANDASTTVTFEYGPTTSYGTTVTANQSPVSGSTNTAVSKAISGLIPNKTYYYRVVGVNSEGTTYSAGQSFTTSEVLVTFGDGSSFTQNITPNTVNQPIGRFQLTANASGATLTATSIRLNGMRSGLSNFKLWLSANSTFEPGSDTQLGSTIGSDPGDGGSVLFTFSSAITISPVYYFLTADVAAAASGTVQGVIVANGSLTTQGTLSGTISNAALSNNTAALPVVLTKFCATNSGESIVLNWQTATEENNYGFEVERRGTGDGRLETREGVSEWEKIGFVKGNGNSNSPKQYDFEDKNAPTGKVNYRLKQIDFDGKYELSNSVEVTVSAPANMSLEQNNPNPFNPMTNISFQTPTSGRVVLKVYDLMGRERATLIDEYKPAGKYTVKFNGTDSASGVYIYVLTTPGGVLKNKMILVK
jgi:hypothetical protein